MVAETKEHLQPIVSEFERACESMGPKANVGKSKMLIVKNDDDDDDGVKGVILSRRRK